MNKNHLNTYADEVMIWTSTYTAGIEMADLDGSSREVLDQDSKPYTYGLTLDTEHIYYTSGGYHNLYCLVF
jgi:glutamine cyclotransferase